MGPSIHQEDIHQPSSLQSSPSTCYPGRWLLAWRNSSNITIKKQTHNNVLQKLNFNCHTLFQPLGRLLSYVPTFHPSGRHLSTFHFSVISIKLYLQVHNSENQRDLWQPMRKNQNQTINDTMILGVDFNLVGTVFVFKIGGW